MRTILVLVAWLWLAAISAMAGVSSDKGVQQFATGNNLLKQHKYQEARTTLEAGIQLNPANAMAHFSLGDACRGLKAWACAEEHYETSMKLDAKSTVIEMAKQRSHNAKAWRMLEEGKRVVNEPNASLEKLAQAKAILDNVNKLGLDNEQQSLYQQLQDKIQQAHTRSSEKPASAGPQGPSMVPIPAGEFTMGSSEGDSDEQPAHKVYVDAFSIDAYEVTVGQYAAFRQATGANSPSDWQMMNQSANQKRPVANVDWEDAAAYCKWVGKRLPTEAEWEKAARGTDGRLYPWGNDPPTPLHANYGKSGANNNGALAPVGMLEEGKSPYGVYDMAGNVWEWVSDWYDHDYYKNSPPQNPTGPSRGGFKVLRGGAWNTNPKNLRSADRYWDPPTFRSQYFPGFRCAKTP
jgi:formylglycine-generating enzyme required for sulfatase activity